MQYGEQYRMLVKGVNSPTNLFRSGDHSLCVVTTRYDVDTKRLMCGAVKVLQ